MTTICSNGVQLPKDTPVETPKSKPHVNGYEPSLPLAANYVPRFILETGKIGVITGYLPKKERCSVLIEDESLALSPGNFLLGLQPDVTRRGTIVRLQGQKAAAPWNGAVRRVRDFFVQEASGSRYWCVDLGNEMQLNGKPEILCQ
eukprot:g13883.t1